MKKILSALLCMLVMLTACTNSTEPVETNDTLLSLEDDTYYLELGSDLDLAKALKLEDGETLELDGDYDLSKSGTYSVRFVVTDKDGNKTESEKTIIVDEKEKLDELKKEQEANKPADPSISKDQPTETEKPADGTVVETPIESKEPVETTDSSPESNTNTSSGNTSSNTGGLDTSDWRIALAYEKAGTSQGGCEAAAQNFANEIGFNYQLAIGGDINTTNGPAGTMSFGDVIRYYDENGAYRHTAFVLGNGMCYHGNYNSDGTAAVASCQLSYPTMHVEKPCDGGCIDWGDTIDNSSSSSGSSSGNPDDAWVNGKSPAAEYYENDAAGYTPDMCAVPAIELSNNSSLAFWCTDYYEDLIIW